MKTLAVLAALAVASPALADGHLPDLGGRKRLEALGVEVRTLIAFEGD